MPVSHLKTALKMMELIIANLKQRVPLKNICIDDLDSPLEEDAQAELLSVLIEIANYNTYYSMTVLKFLINNLETKNGDYGVNEDYYEYLMEWMNAKPLQPTDTDVITYTFNQEIQINIRESPNLISGLGTTGLRTWEASLVLAEYMMDNDLTYSESGDILELGCGTGMVSISMLKKHPKRANKLFITDGDSQLIERVQENIRLNNFNIDKECYDIGKLWWGEDYIPASVRTLLAADVTYDATIIPDLVHLLNESMCEGNVELAIIAATVRNEDTLAVFDNWLNMGVEDKVWKWEIIQDSVPRSNTLYFGAFPSRVLLYRITRL